MVALLTAPELDDARLRLVVEAMVERIVLGPDRALGVEWRAGLGLLLDEAC